MRARLSDGATRLKAQGHRGALLVVFLAIAASIGAYGLVFGVDWPPIATEPSSSLRVLVVALVGGVALAFNKAMLPLHLLLAGRLDWGGVSGNASQVRGLERVPYRAGLCLLGFGLAFVVGISGRPRVLSQPLYAYAKGIARVAGGVLILGGLVASVEVMAGLGRGRILGRILGNWKGLLDVAAGMALGLALYHDIDPTYDSLFFATGTAVAASHSALAVAVFVVASGATLLAVAWGLLRAASLAPRVTALLYGIHLLGAGGILAVGTLLTTGAYEGFATMVGLHR